MSGPDDDRPPPRNSDWTPTDWIAIIIAGTLSLSALIVVTATALIPEHDPLSDIALEAMGNIGQVLAGALAAYLGIRLRGR